MDLNFWGYLLICDYKLCEFTTKKKSALNAHQKIHTHEHTLNRKKEETKIKNLLIQNNIQYKREHQISYSCINELIIVLHVSIFVSNIVI